MRELWGNFLQAFRFVFPLHVARAFGLSYMLVVIIRHEDSLFSKTNYGFITDRALRSREWKNKN
jgi:hypothetical protein